MLYALLLVESYLPFLMFYNYDEMQFACELAGLIFIHDDWWFMIDGKDDDVDSIDSFIPSRDRTSDWDASSDFWTLHVCVIVSNIFFLSNSSDFEGLQF